jgi:hypothetical protein
LYSAMCLSPRNENRAHKKTHRHFDLAAGFSNNRAFGI